mgnify:CR=1 FL=1
MKQEEQELVAACMHLDQKACKTMYDRFAPVMMGVCMRYMQDRSAAQDVLQEGFIKVFSRLRQLRSSDSLQSWVKSIMIHTCIDTLRSQQFSLIDEDSTTLEDGMEPPYENFDRDLIVQAIQQLPPKLRSAFNLYEVEGYTDKEIAKMMGISSSSVRVYALRAKSILAEKLKELDNRV